MIAASRGDTGSGWTIVTGKIDGGELRVSFVCHHRNVESLRPSRRTNSLTPSPEWACFDTNFDHSDLDLRMFMRADFART